MYKALVNGLSEEFHHAILKALDQEPNPLRAIERHIAVRREVFFNNLPVVRLYFAETRGASFSIKAGLDREILKKHDEFIERLASVFERGVKEGVFRDLEPYHMALALDGVINAFLFRMLEDPEGFGKGKGDNLTAATDIFLGGVLRQ